jgi:hypothetical protein
MGIDIHTPDGISNRLSGRGRTEYTVPRTLQVAPNSAPPEHSSYSAPTRRNRHPLRQWLPRLPPPTWCSAPYDASNVRAWADRFLSLPLRCYQVEANTLVVAVLVPPVAGGRSLGAEAAKPYAPRAAFIRRQEIGPAGAWGRGGEHQQPGIPDNRSFNKPAAHKQQASHRFTA